MGLCAYCDLDSKLTREELYPKFLVHRTPKYDNYIDHGRPQKPANAAPVVRDVCAPCNNELLGSLDGYAATLADKYFNLFLEKPVNVTFECDTEKLLRWLLKLLFNDARISGLPLAPYQGLRPFILGACSSPDVQLSLLAGLIEPFNPPGSKEIFYPTHQGFGNFTVDGPENDLLSLFGAIFLNSYVFYVMAWRPDAAQPLIARALTTLMEGKSLTPLPRPVCSVHLSGACMSTEALMAATVDAKIAF